MGFLDAEVLSKQQKNALLEYKYRGGDNSIAYKYLLSPMAQSLVDNCTPAWMAPNLITSIGLLIHVFDAVVTLIVDPTLTNAPKWLPFLTGFCFFAYQTLDNMDGKQARKIGASSPLGLLFDHGCDALCAGMTAVPLASVFGGGWKATSFFTIWVSAFLTFYTQTWEEYYLHEMFLPMFNGASEGLIMIVISCCISGVYGVQWWQTPQIQLHPKLVPFFPFQILIVQVAGLVAPSICTQIVKVLTKLYNDKSSSRAVRAANLKQAILGLVLIFTFIISNFLWCFISKSAMSLTPIQFYLFVTCVFVEMATHMMFMHVTSSTLMPQRRFLAWSSVLLPLNSFFGNYANVYHKVMSYITCDSITSYFTVANRGAAIIGGTDLTFALTPLVDEVLMMNVLAAAAVVVVSFKVYRMVNVMADTINCNVFTLGKRTNLNANAPAFVPTSSKVAPAAHAAKINSRRKVAVKDAPAADAPNDKIKPSRARSKSPAKPGTKARSASPAPARARSKSRGRK